MTAMLTIPRAIKYPAAIRVLHWLRAVLVLGLLVCGWCS